MRLAQGEGKIAAARDLHAIRQCLGQIGEQLRHLGLGLEILLRRECLDAALVVEHVAFGDAHACLVRLEIGGYEELHRMGGNYRQAQFGRELQGQVQVMLLVGESGALHFEVIAVVEQPCPFLRELPGLSGITGQQRAADIAEMRAGQGDQPGSLLMEPLAAQLGTAAMLILKIGARKQAAQQQIARIGLAQQQQAIRTVAIGIVADEHIATGDGLETRAACRFIEFDQPKKIIQIGQRQRRHRIALRRGNRFVHTHHAIRNGIFAVQTEVDEGRLRHDETPEIWGVILTRWERGHLARN